MSRSVREKCASSRMVGAITAGVLAAGLLMATARLAEVEAADWHSWRGPLQTGVSLEKNLPASTAEILWRVPIGARSAPAIVDGRVFIINLAGEGITEQERVMALDLASGETVWEHRFNVFHTDIPNSRVGWANVAVDAETGCVYAHGVEGMFFCFDRDGKVLWSRSLTETLGRISGYGGRTHTPVVDEDRVIISFLNSSFGDQGKGAHRYLAMDKQTGEILWWSTPGGKPLDTTYSTPVIAVIEGRRMLIAGNADGGIYALDAHTGEKIWGFALSGRGINSSIVVDGHRVYATHSEENHDSTEMGRVVCIDARGSGDVTKTHELWRQDGVPAGYASPVLHGGRLYVVTNFGVLNCYDAESGEEIWRFTAGRVGKGSPVWGDGKIYLPTVNGNFVIVEDAGSEAREVDRLELHSETGPVVEVFGSPSISDGRVVLFTSDEAICFGSSGATREAVDLPPQAAETAAGSTAASIQVSPAEVLAAPGETVSFEAVAFDAGGKPLGSVNADWKLQGSVGSIDADGQFTASGSGGTAVATAEAAGLTAPARIRVVAPLPIEEDFESFTADGMIDWWIGVSKAKHAIESRDGSTVLKKLADDRGPAFNRSRVYVTPPIGTGYTVQADVMGQQVGRRRGDVGVINARYRFELLGTPPDEAPSLFGPPVEQDPNLLTMRVVSWVPGPRFEKKTEFRWESDRWYTVKLRVDVEDGRGMVRAKAWPRGEAEPEQWMIEAVDPQPNYEGAAGIYGFSMAPVYYDNVKIVRE